MAWKILRSLTTHMKAIFCTFHGGFKNEVLFQPHQLTHCPRSQERASHLTAQSYRGQMVRPPPTPYRVPEGCGCRLESDLQLAML